MAANNSSRTSPPLLISLADQSFTRAKSVGILNVSVGLARALVAARPAGGVVFFSNEELRGCLPADGGAPIVREFRGAAESRWGRIWYDQVAVYRAARRFPGAWLLLPKGFASFLLPPPRGIRLACYVHDTMQAHYRRNHPHFFPRFERTYFWRGFQATLRRADLILTNSQFTAAEVASEAKAAGIPVGPVTCVGIGFDPAASAMSATGRSGLIVLASRMPHKLTAQAADWLARWQRERMEFKETLHWVGSLPNGSPLPPFQNWQHLPRLDDAAYHELMNRARALVYFSEYEGFGMPPVEAIFRGAAPVYSDIPATREVMKGRGLPFDNRVFESFAGALDCALMCGPGIVEAGRQELEATMCWPDVAQRVLASMSRVSSGEDRGKSILDSRTRRA